MVLINNEEYNEYILQNIFYKWRTADKIQIYIYYLKETS